MVIDIYEDYEVLGVVDSKRSASKLARERVNDTDGECYIVLKEQVLNHWIPVKDWVY